jgi:hypothetical protein
MDVWIVTPSMDDLLDGIARHLEAGLATSDPSERSYHFRHALQYLEGLDEGPRVTI